MSFTCTRKQQNVCSYFGPEICKLRVLSPSLYVCPCCWLRKECVYPRQVRCEETGKRRECERRQRDQLFSLYASLALVVLSFQCELGSFVERRFSGRFFPSWWLCFVGCILFLHSLLSRFFHTRDKMSFFFYKQFLILHME